MRKIIFLDIDGVICNVDEWRSPCLDDHHHDFSKSALECLHKIISNTHAEVVVSSSWRSNVKKMRELFTKRGFKYPEQIIDVTVRYHHCVEQVKDRPNLPIVRGNEIQEWIDHHLKYPWYAYPERKDEFEEKNEDGSFKSMKSQKVGVDYSYVILDDDSDMLYPHYLHFIQTHAFHGMHDEDAAVAIDILNGNFNSMRKRLIKNLLDGIT